MKKLDHCHSMHCVRELCTLIRAHTCEHFLNLHVGLGLDSVLVYLLFMFTFLCVFGVSLDRFISMLLVFLVLGLVSSVPSEEIGWEERLRNDIFCVG